MTSGALTSTTFLMAAEVTLLLLWNWLLASGSSSWGAPGVGGGWGLLGVLLRDHLTTLLITTPEKNPKKNRNNNNNNSLQDVPGPDAALTLQPIDFFHLIFLRRAS